MQICLHLLLSFFVFFLLSCQDAVQPVFRSGTTVVNGSDHVQYLLLDLVEALLDTCYFGMLHRAGGVRQTCLTIFKLLPNCWNET